MPIILPCLLVTLNKFLNISGRNAIYEILDDLLSVLFPGSLSKEEIQTSDLKYFIDMKLRNDESFPNYSNSS